MRNLFKGKQFDKRVIIEAVGLYCRFSLSYRDVSEILRHRGRDPGKSYNHYVVG